MLDQKFLRFTIDRRYPQANIYITTKEFLKPTIQNATQKQQKLNQLAMMDIIAIINFADKETLYDDVLQLTPRSEQKCQDIPFNWMQGAVKFIDHVIKLQQRSVAVFCNQEYSFSHLCLVCYLMYNQFSLLTQIKDLPQVQDVKCSINFQGKEITLLEDKDGILRQFYGSPENPNYLFKINIMQIGEAEKFQLTKQQSQIRNRVKGGLQQNDWSVSIYQKQPKSEDLSNAGIISRQLLLTINSIRIQQKFKQEMKYQAALFAKRNEIYIIVKLFVVEADFVNPFSNLDQTTTIENIEQSLEILKKQNIQAIINCVDSDQSMKPYGISYLNIHINFLDQLESARLFIHVMIDQIKSFGLKLEKALLQYIVIAVCKKAQRYQNTTQNLQIIGMKREFREQFVQQFQEIELQQNNEKTQIIKSIGRSQPPIDWTKIYDEKNQENDGKSVNQSIKSRFVSSRIIQQQQ